ncbi:major capsid protein [Albibacterium profundi]|uniref:Phage capsid protein n=1 Tax=Albibacterium profundi TaxID=3134906 RepID=A0ABV5CEX6_9SPHI
MIKSLMRGLQEKDMQAVVNTYELKNYYYPSLFPITSQKSLTWKALEVQTGLRVAGDVISFNSSIPKKDREAIARIDGDIPKIGLSREKTEDFLNEYNNLRALANSDEDLRRLVEMWAEDTEFCWAGVANRLEWIALRQISLGKVKFTNQNNAAVVTQFDVDYQIPASQKMGVTDSWNASGAKVTQAFKAAIKAGKDANSSLKFAWMNMDTFSKMVEQEEIIKKSASFANNALGISQTPDLSTVNSMLSRQAWLNGLQIILVDQDITLELANGKRNTGNPFEDDVVLFTESKVLGKTFHAPLADESIEGSVALKTKRSHTLIKKYAIERPTVTEVTEGMANAFPAWMGAGRSVLMQTNNSTWNK